MNIVSHALFPIVFAQAINGYYTHNRKPLLFGWKPLLLIGLTGALPDILSPHFSFESRYTSLTHSIMFLLTAAVVSLIVAWRFQRFRTLSYFCFFAILLHFICDMISGGINLFAPAGTMIVGSNYVRARYWISLDLSAIFFFSLSCLYNRYRARGRFFLLVSGLIVCLCGTGLAFSLIDSDKIFLKRIPASEMRLAQDDRIQRVLVLFKKLQAGTFESLSDEFTETMRREMTPQFQEALYRRITGAFGDFQGISFEEMATTRFGYPHYRIYRFKASFSRTLQPIEIRIFFDANGKISGLRYSGKFYDRIIDY
jgi:hypothetical protein